MSGDIEFMRRCLQLARCGEAGAQPNPMVGAVVVCDGRIIGEGYHRRCGGPHAEVNAISSVKEKHLLSRSTIYVSLEPCAHYGKTPPCADLIVRSSIPRVVIGCTDPFAKVNGLGIKKLKDAGCEVIVGVLEDECRKLNHRFFTFHQKRRPWITLKWAQSEDGFIGKDERVILSNALTQTLVHRLRARSGAILVGTRTALIDNPTLTTRYWTGPNPLRLTIDRHGILPPTLHLKDNSTPTVIYSHESIEEILADLDNYIGLDSVKDEIRAIVKNVKKKKDNGMNEKLLKDHYLFTGNPGTGKTTFARKFGEVLNAIGALPTGQFVEISGKDLIGQYVGDSEANVRRYVNQAMGGVLFIDEAYALKGSSGDKGSYGMDAVNTILNLLENRKGEFVCIMAGYTKEMADFVRMNPGIPSRCNVTIEFPDYSARELEQLFRMMLEHNDEKRNGEQVVFTLDQKAEEMLPKVFDKMYLKRSDTFGNAREVRNLFDACLKRHRKRDAQDDIFTYTDLVGEEATEEISVDDIMKELDQFVGMESVKSAIRRIAQDIAVQKQLVEMGEAAEGLTKFNFVLTGKPGTGKTTVARTFGKIFKALGVTSTDRVIEKVPDQILSQYVNESSKNMNDAINEAMGGVLFLDEAYGIEPMDEAGKSTSSEGRDAIKLLLTRMENEAGKFVVICAGYPKEMETFMNSNPGLRSRFSHTIHIDDYTADELLEIYERAAKARKYNFTLADDEVRMKALNMFRNMVAMKDDKFGNAREVMKKVEETKTNINNRLRTVPYDQWTPELIHTAFLDDIPYVEPAKVSIDECLAELNQLIGLSGVKNSLTKLAHTINNEIESARLENRRPEIPLGHYLFLGNPGTGKTTVARLMGKILYSMGALPSPNVVEVDRSKLVGRFMGDAENITSHVIDTAMGGILFIDEAYQLADNYGSGSGYGDKALQTLVTRLENDRGKFVCIAAGYTHEMEDFIHANSGFESRFPARNRIIFEDYTPDELFQIFMIHANEFGYVLDAMAENAVRGKLTMMYNNRGRSFGNGREARNLFDDVKSNLAARLAEEGGEHTPEERKTIKMEDVL